MTSEPAALRGIGLSKRYRGRFALRDCDFSVPEGRVAALVGPNGAGKSTLLAVAAGLVRPTTGTVSVLDSEVRGKLHPDMAFLAQHRPLYGKLTVSEMLRAGRELNERWSSARAEEVLALLAGVDHDARIDTLSEGARTQVALAIALARGPRVLLLDEPLSSLDPLARDEILRILMTEVAERGTTVVMSSHLLNDLRDVCDHILLLDRGRIQLAGDLEDILDEHRFLVGPAAGEAEVGGDVVWRSSTDRQATLLVRGEHVVPSGWAADPVDIEALVLAYLRASRDLARSTG
ncbi:ABC transporter ATP-binding protein [Allokutzneria oryzae]|uniref:ABC transporter ATP-binding protein n=1 Tax=Allokutzneria oryzae TaxID=1378989 RepID=A0ABV5ZVT5_9PSEU